MHKYIYLALVVTIFPLVALAGSNDVSLGDGVNIGPYDLIIRGTTNIESIVADTASLTVTMPASSFIHIESPSRHTMSAAGVDTSYITQQQCGNSNALEITVPAGASTQTVTIGVGVDTCTGRGGGGSAVSSGSSSASSGASSSGNSTVSTPTPTPTTVAVVPTATPSVVISPIRIQATFSADLSKGTTNSDVTRLQQLLASDKSIYPEGLVTGYFGPATERAVKRFQAKYGIDQVGRVGPATRAKLGVVFGTSGATPAVSVTSATPAIPGTAPAVPATPATPATVTTGSAVFTQNMSVGATGDDVTRLQKFLNSDADTKIADEGVGSPGNETTMFGSLTEGAVQRFQVKYNIAKEGDSGYGTVGPMTRAMLQEVFGATR